MEEQIQLSIEGVSKAFGSKSVLQNLSFELKKGEILSFLGNSGSGKSTLLRIIAGFEQADKGDIISGQQSIINKPTHLRNVGMFFQNYALFPHLNVEQNIGYGLSKSEKSRVSELIEMCQLKGEEKKLIYQISGGQQQRVALARALAPRPQVLLLDEPFSNIDAQLKDDLRVELKSLIKQAGISAIFVSHDIDDAFAIADRALLLDQGEVQQVDVPENLYRKPKNKFVARFMGDAYFVKGRVNNDELITEEGSHFLYKTSMGNVSLVVRQEDFNIVKNTKNGQFSIVDVVFKRSFKEIKCTCIYSKENYKILGPKDIQIGVGDLCDIEISGAHIYSE
ncbi:MAG: ABC transporter ATP-binding protein [Flavobacteriales bacterium]